MNGSSWISGGGAIIQFLSCMQDAQKNPDNCRQCDWVMFEDNGPGTL